LGAHYFSTQSSERISRSGSLQFVATYYTDIVAQLFPSSSRRVTGYNYLIQLEDVSKVFLTDEVETHALTGIHLEVEAGEFVQPGTPLFDVGPLTASREGVERALAVVVKANAVALIMFALLGTLDVVRFARGLAGLRLPPALVDLLLLAGRYVDVIGREHRRLRQAMTARAFRPRTDGHTWQALGWLVGMVLVRAFERAERVYGAMRCRGFRGELHLAEGGGRFGGNDGLFALALAGAACGLIGLDWR